MEDNKTANKIHPLMAGAAVSVMLVSLVGVAAITGLIPNSHSTVAPPLAIAPSNAPAVATAASSPAALLDSAPEKNVVANSFAAPATQPPQGWQPAPAPKQERNYAPREASNTYSEPRPTYKNPSRTAQAPSVCSSCGHVESVQAIQQHAQPSGFGMVTGAVLGGVLGNQVGGGNGRKLATVAGAVGGGYAGNEVEKRARGTTTYQVRVRMDNGSVRSFPHSAQPHWSVGDRVRVVNGQLTARASPAR